MNLYQLSADYLAALTDLTEADGLPPEAIADTLEGLEGTWCDKAVNVARFILGLEAEAEAIREAVTRMEIRLATTQRRAQSLRAYLTAEAIKTGLTASAPDIGTIRLRTNPPAVVIDDSTQVPEKYLVTKTTTTLSRADIAADLKAGLAVPGARLEQTQRLTIG